ncbi:MAG: SMP-30/gluconolactonase/LRE family protein [Burkholderiales bacterium]|nr:SMP-30/gluconolactonase/LRE family protein [Burkholderiales bacterium]
MTNRISPDWYKITAERFSLAESPRWAHQQLRWVDINERRMMVSRNPFQQDWKEAGIVYESVSLPDQIACLIPTVNPSCWLGFGRTGIWKLQDNTEAQLMMESPFDQGNQRFNDGCCDAWGRVWINTLIDDKRAALGSLYCFEKGKLRKVLGNFTTGNAMAFNSTSGLLYVGDTKARQIKAYLTHRENTALQETAWQVQYTVGTERPDGATLSSDQAYFVAIIDGFRIDVFKQENIPFAHIQVPFNKVTMPCFAGDEMQYLVVTSSRTEAENRLNDKLESGCLIAAETVFRGTVSMHYKLE